MKRLIGVFFIVVALVGSSLQAQLLLTPGESFTYEFSTLNDFGDGYPGPARGFATFYTDADQSTPGATYRVDLFESNAGDNPIASNTGTGNVTATANNGWQDLQGVARVTVTSGAVFFESLVINVYKPSFVPDYQLWSSGTVPVPEPGTITLGVLGLIGLIGWSVRTRQRR
jgi:hypothetical protein